MRCSDKEQSLLHQDVKKFGYDSFEWDVIDRADNKASALELEKYYIDIFNSRVPNGYNEIGNSFNYASKKVVCLNLDGTYVKTYASAMQADKEDGYCNSDILLCCKNIQRRVKDKMFMFEDDYLNNGAKEYQKPKANGLKSIIQCSQKGDFIEEFDSVSEASKKTKITRSRISSNLTMQCKSAGGYIWVYKEKFPINDMSVYAVSKKGRKVAQIDIKTNEIVSTYDRVTDAAKVMNGDYKYIHKVLDNPNMTAYGFKWISQ